MAGLPVIQPGCPVSRPRWLGGLTAASAV